MTEQPMGAPRHLHIVDEVGELPADGAVLLVATDGFLDAGHAAGIAVDSLVDGAMDGRAEGQAPVVASFDIDAFYDYRARRPAVSFSRDHYSDYAPPRLVVRRLLDATGTPYLVLRGAEPDNLWEAYARAFRELVERLGVRLVVTLGSIPMAVPHTRPIAMTPHGNNPELIPGPTQWQSDLRVPASAQSLVEIRLGEWGHDAMGLVAHVPHYLAQESYPQASVSLLEATARTTGLVFDLDGLRDRTAERRREIDRTLADNEEVAGAVAGLEQQYDAFTEAAESGDNLLAEERPLPTGEEIGAQFERFLAGLDGPDDAPSGEDEGPDPRSE